MIDVDQAREMARQIEQDYPHWIVIFGTFTEEFVCFPRFDAKPGTMVTARYLPAAAGRMAQIERNLGIEKDTSGMRSASNAEGRRHK
jgi:hypothetical protein